MRGERKARERERERELEKEWERVRQREGMMAEVKRRMEMEKTRLEKMTRGKERVWMAQEMMEWEALVDLGKGVENRG